MKKSLIILMVTALLLTGCGAKMPNLDEEQSRQVAEYAVGLLMKYDANHESRLLSDAQLEEELARLQNLAERKAEMAAADQKAKEEKEKAKAEKEQQLAETPVVGQDGNVVSGQYVDEFFGIEGITIRYQGYEVKDSYPDEGENLYFMMQAGSGKKLLVLKFKAENTTAEERTLDMITLAPKFKIGINNEASRYAMSTLLSEDMANYRGTLAAAEAVELVLIAEIPEEISDNISNIAVNMQNNENSATTLLD